MTQLELNDEISRIQRLLLTPDQRAMQEVEGRLSGLISDIRARRTPQFETLVRNAVGNLNFLLENAKQFWNRRRIARAPGLQYAATGALVENVSECSFAMEV